MNNWKVLLPIAIVLIAVLYIISVRNTLASDELAVEAAASQVDVQLQRRSDLIPNLVNTVKGYSTYESETLSKITDARAKVEGSASLQEKNAANNDLTAALSRLIAVQENYPQLKADKHYTDLMRELSGTENRITVARTRYNEAVQKYDQSIVRFPRSAVASIFGFTKKPMLETPTDKKDAPQVSF